MKQESAFKDKTVLVTGGTGSFGRTFVAEILRYHNPRKVIIFSRDEWKQWEMRESDPIYRDERVRYFLGDVRDSNRLERAFNKVDIVIHAAALKQVPVAEYNPTEFIKTNIMGAMNVLDASLNANVEKVIALSTDKAVNPVNLYGATKLCSDKLFVSGNAYVGGERPCFSVVRYGNVLGSRGSIIPFWNDVVKSGKTSLPITDKRMTRFWMTIDQAVSFVIQSAHVMKGGEIFVPKIPSMKILDLAEALIPGIDTHVTGIREGEKLHEQMISSEDSRHTFEFPEYYVIASHSRGRSYLTNLWNSGQYPDSSFSLVEDGFVYASNTNKSWLSPEQLRDVLSLPDSQPTSEVSTSV